MTRRLLSLLFAVAATFGFAAGERRVVQVDVSPVLAPWKTVDAETGRPNGYLGWLIGELEANSDLQFEVLPPTDRETAQRRFLAGESDVWFDYGAGSARSLRAESGLPVARIAQFCALRKGRRPAKLTSARVAVRADDRSRIEVYSQIPTLQLVVRQTVQACLKSVLTGEADVFIDAYWVIRDGIDGLAARNQLVVEPLESASYKPEFAAIVSRSRNPELYDAFKTALESVSPTERVYRLYGAAAERTGVLGLTREQLSYAVCVVVLLVVAVTLTILFVSRRRIKAALDRSRKALMVADDALREAADIRKRLTVALKEANSAADAKTQFLATMSHEIRTPLNSVIGFSEFLQMPGVTEAKMREYSADIHRSATALLSLINDILDISKLESGMVDVRTGVTDVSAIISEAVNVFRLAASRKGLEFRMDCPEGLPKVRFSEARLRQILFNLLGNAVKYTERGFVEVKVRLEPNKDGNLLYLAVSDSGIGISPDKQRDIFNPFVQDLESRKGRTYEGTGLGLAIVNRLVQAAGGTLSVRSALGKGSTFMVTIGAVAAVENPSPAEAGAVPPLAEFVPPEDFTVVAVDDIQMNLKIIAGHLRRLGATTVVTFASIRAALDWIGKNRTDIVLTDVWMPEMNGGDFARAIHRLPGREHLPVVAVTADTDPAGSFDVSDCAAILTKPITAVRLRECLSRLVPTSPVPPVRGWEQGYLQKGG